MMILPQNSGNYDFSVFDRPPPALHMPFPLQLQVNQNPHYEWDCFLCLHNAFNLRIA